MQLGAAAVFLIGAARSAVIPLLYVFNHDSRLQVAAVLIFGIFFATLEIIAAVGSFIGWRWMFWAALTLLGLGGLSNLVGGLTALVRPEASAIAVDGWIVTMLVGGLSLAMFAWMLVGVIQYGPWAIRRAREPA